MFIDDFVSVAVGVSSTNAWLIARGEEITRAAAQATTPTVTVVVGPVRTRSDCLVIPILWSPESPSPLQELQGDLQTSPLNESATHLSLSASCRVPIDPLGRRTHALAARRRAEQSVRQFLGCIACELERRSATGTPLHQ